MILIYATFSNKEEAERIIQKLLEKKIIACATFFPVESRYWWKGKITKDNEQAVLIKTKKEKWKEIKKEIEKEHSYNVPCIIKIPVEINKKYQLWAEKEIK